MFSAEGRDKQINYGHGVGREDEHGHENESVEITEKVSFSCAIVSFIIAQHNSYSTILLLSPIYRIITYQQVLLKYIQDVFQKNLAFVMQ